jgi:uncharacterized membrane protein
VDDKETGRVEAFSDGVFAVAITLLVLNIHGLNNPANPPPDFGSHSILTLSALLRGQWPTYLAFATSFATIGVMWINHHRLFTHIKHVDTNLFALNLFLLFVIVFIPFPTALLASYITHPEDHLAALLYSATGIVLAISFSLLWRYASHKNRLLGENVDQEAVQAITNQYRLGPLFYVLAFVLAFIYVPASVVLTLLLALFFALPGRRVRSTTEG